MGDFIGISFYHRDDFMISMISQVLRGILGGKRSTPWYKIKTGEGAFVSEEDTKKNIKTETFAMMSLMLDKWLRIVVKCLIFCLDFNLSDHKMDNPKSCQTLAQIDGKKLHRWRKQHSGWNMCMEYIFYVVVFIVPMHFLWHIFHQVEKINLRRRH